MFTKKPLVLYVNELSQTYEKGIFYGAVLARGGIFFIELIWDWQGAAKSIYVFGGLFLLLGDLCKLAVFLDIVIRHKRKN